MEIKAVWRRWKSGRTQLRAVAAAGPSLASVLAVGFLRRAVAHFGDYGIRVERVMTDG